MHERTGRRTVPQILMRGFSIGGSDDLVRLNESGQLDRLLGVPASAEWRPILSHARGGNERERGRERHCYQRDHHNTPS